jgi:predicted secreted Zn-dependent protease
VEGVPPDRQARDPLAMGDANLAWRKSTYTMGNGNCVEVAALPDYNLAIRDSKDKTGPILRCSPTVWRAFIAGIKDGEFD